jgi:hypothetical protein
MLYSRQEFAIFTFRAHNAVNARLLRPIYGSVEECLATLGKAVESRPARDYRVAYLNHIMQNWRTYQDITGITAMKKILEMRRIETDYVASRDTKFDVTLTPDVVVLPSSAFTQASEQRVAPHFNPRLMGDVGGFRMTAGGFRLRR